MKRTMTCIIVAAAVAFDLSASAVAQTLTLEIAETDLRTWISNNTASPISADGLEFQSTSGILDPVNWRSIADAAVSDPAAVSAALGSGALSFIEVASSNSHDLAELNFSSMASWQPGTRWSIGFPFGASVAVFHSRSFDGTFRYATPAGGVVAGSIVFVPEPATLLLAFAAAIGLLFTVRRRHRI
jgi:PEP-CTERM motif